MSTASPSALRPFVLSALLLAWGGAALAKPNGWQSDTCTASLACETANGTHVSYPISTHSEATCEDQLAAADGARYITGADGACYLHVVDDCNCYYTWKDANGGLHDSDFHVMTPGGGGVRDPRFPNITGSLSASNGAVLGFEGSLSQGVLQGQLFDEAGLEVGDLTLHPNNTSAGTADFNMVLVQEGVRYGAHGAFRLADDSDAQVLVEDDGEDGEEEDMEVTGLAALFSAAFPRPHANTGLARPGR